MDFINARRFLEEEYQEYLKDPEAYRGFPDPVESFLTAWIPTMTFHSELTPELRWGSAPDPGV